MTNLRLVVAIGLAAVSLALTLSITIAGVALAVAGLAQPVGLSAIFIGAASFIISWKQRSFPVAGLLVASGLIFMNNAMAASGYFKVLVFPGPIIGVFLGLALLGIGLAKGIGTTRKLRAAPR